MSDRDIFKNATKLKKNSAICRAKTNKKTYTKSESITPTTQAETPTSSKNFYEQNVRQLGQKRDKVPRAQPMQPS